MKLKELTNCQSKTSKEIKNKVVGSLFQKSSSHIPKEPKEESPCILTKKNKSTKTGTSILIPNLYYYFILQWISSTFSLQQEA